MHMRENFHTERPEAIEEWLKQENLDTKNSRLFQGFEIIDSIDGGINTEREVSLVRIIAVGQYPQHIHKESNATFIITKGEGVYVSGHTRQQVKSGDRLVIPRGTPHGFELGEGQKLEFISIQSPPIRNIKTGEEDFHLTDII